MTDRPPRTLYVSRPLLDGARLRAWARRALGLRSALAAADMHVTVAFSRAPVNWFALSPDRNLVLIPEGEADREVKRLGKATVLRFRAPELERRWREFRDRAGASWDHPSYQPHVTLTYTVPEGTDLHDATPFDGPLRFGPERWAEVKDDWPVDVQEEPLRKAGAPWILLRRAAIPRRHPAPGGGDPRAS